MSLVNRVPSPCAVGIVGATGLVGELLLSILAERAFPVASLRLFASERSAGKRIHWRKREIAVEDAATADFAGLDIVFFCVPSAHVHDVNAIPGYRDAGESRASRHRVSFSAGPKRP